MAVPNLRSVSSTTATEELPIEQIIAKLREERDRRRFKEQVISLMSHELRTPLTSIQLSYDMLARYSERATPEERGKYLENIRRQVHALNNIVSDVLQLSHALQAGFDYQPREQDLCCFCGDIVESFALSYMLTHQVSFDCPEGAILAEFDENLLRRALTNLLSNAIKYSPDGGRVRAQLWREGERARLSIADDGIGIPPEDMDFLLLAFHRAGNVGSLPGTGLGLAITKQALDAHGGDIRFRSGPGRGTTVEVELPLGARSALRLAGGRQGDSRKAPTGFEGERT